MKRAGSMLLLGMMLGLATGAGQAASRRWIDIDTDGQTLTVYDDSGRAIRQFDDISIGSGGVADVHLAGDHTTPRGHFHVVNVRPSSRFDTFILLDYPQPAQADRALHDGSIDAATRAAIDDAVFAGQLPPQDTRLGGEIGIHGLGRDSTGIHRRFNWTSGCIALTNRQIRQLAGLVSAGTDVVIH